MAKQPLQRLHATVSLAASAASATVAVVLGSFRVLLDHWAPLADWVVAFGTGTLAFATFRLARRAHEEAKAVAEESRQVGEQIELQREQLRRGSQAYVYPWVPTDWAIGSDYWADHPRLEALPLRNGGRGLARNVKGKASALGEGVFIRAEIYAGTIAAGEQVTGRLSREMRTGWSSASGEISFVDEQDTEWVTRFRFSTGEGNQLVCEHDPPERVIN
jgi:hypothetical protein